MNNVIDASNRFGPEQSKRPRTPQMDKLRQSARTPRNDAILIAQRLGEIAQKLTPKSPPAAARQWFEVLWEGDRWEKRKRYILFAGETAPDPVASNGADWAALIAQAALALYPEESNTSDKERARICRDILRGTSFLPAINNTPLHSETAQTLMVDLACKICEAIEAKSEIVRLWDVLEETPFDLYSYDLEQPKFDEQEIDGPFNAMMRANSRFEGDTFSRGPLGEVARKADGVSRYRYRQDSWSSYRFEPRCGYGFDDWAFPLIRLGIFGYRRKSRIFVIPHGFTSELPFDQKFEAGDKVADERVLEWLVTKKIIHDADYASLPEVSYSKELGYGWHPFTFDVPRLVWLEARPRTDGSPGLWLTSEVPDESYTYPVLSALDTLALQADVGIQRGLNFLAMPLERSTYVYLEWPDKDSILMRNRDIPDGAFSGLLDLDATDISDVTGWIDDLENSELQEFLFRPQPDARFCPSIPTEDDVPPPCRAGTLAAAIFSNAGSTLGNRIAMQLIEQSQEISERGLEFHAALLATHRLRIQKMIPD